MVNKNKTLLRDSRYRCRVCVGIDVHSIWFLIGLTMWKCVEGDMFDIALRIVNDHKELASDGEVLRIMATKPDAFVENSSNILWKTINWVFAFVLSRRTLPKWIREELELLESMEDIVRNPEETEGRVDEDPIER
ncbi:hypothetical protein Tco_0989654 [Tanacetum coccineum]|uniref:Cytochrome P450 n=1 Tax=Tanacetum coccineum TaxID=301880 RepID=A0ABQ5EVD5_9ASTR